MDFGKVRFASEDEGEDYDPNYNPEDEDDEDEVNASSLESSEEGNEEDEEEESASVPQFLPGAKQTVALDPSALQKTLSVYGISMHQ